MNQSTADKAPPAGPPWIDHTLQQRVKWRDGDIVISAPAKSGTTWTMNIVYQLLAGGTADFKDVYAEVPWLELVSRPGNLTKKESTASKRCRRRVAAHSRRTLRRRPFRSLSKDPVKT